MPRPNKSMPLPDLVAQLADYGITAIPSTNEGCLSILRFIRTGRGMSALTKESRVALLKTITCEWVARRVWCGNRFGTVKYILPKSFEKAYVFRRTVSVNLSRHLTFFSAGVLWDGERQTRIADFDSLELVYSGCYLDFLFK